MATQRSRNIQTLYYFGFYILLFIDLSASILNSSEEVIETITDHLVITIPQNDTYKIMVEAENHKGSFMITWDVDDKE